MRSSWHLYRSKRDSIPFDREIFTNYVCTAQKKIDFKNLWAWHFGDLRYLWRHLEKSNYLRF